MKQIYKQICIALFFMAVAVVMSWPAAGNMTSHIIGEGGDPWQTLWRFEYKYEALLTAQQDGVLGQFIASEFFGTGGERLVNLSVWPWMPVYALLGQPQAYNVIWLLSFALSGYAMYLLTRWLLREHAPPGVRVDSEAGAILAGLLYQLLPFHVAHSLGHFGAMQLQWLPLLFLLAWLWLKKPTLWRTVGLVVLITAQVWTEHHYALWFLISMLVVFWAQRVRVRELLMSTVARRQALIGVLLLACITLPSVLPTVRLATSNTSLSLGAEQTVRFSTDVFSYITPAPFHPVWGGMFGALFSHRFTGNVTEATAYLGLVPLLVIVFFHQRVPRQQLKFWLVLGGTFWLLSLGPRLHVLGIVTPLPLPYTLIDGWPLFSAVRAIGRTAVIVGLSIGVLFGWVVATQVHRKQFVYLLGGLLLVEFLFLPMPLIPAVLSPAYSAARALPGSTLIELPAATNYTAASRALYATLTHGKSIVGNIALERAQDSDAFAESQSLPALRQLLHLRTTHIRQDRKDFFDQGAVETLPDTLRWLDVGGILVHSDSLSPLQLSATRNFLEDDLGLIPSDFSDGFLYDVSPLLEAGDSDGVFLARDGRWQNVGFDEERESVFAELPTEATTTLYNVSDQTQVVRLQFQVPLEGHGNVVVRTEDDVLVADLTAGPGELVEIEYVLEPGSVVLHWRNKLTQKVIIQNPALSASLVSPSVIQP